MDYNNITLEDELELEMRAKKKAEEAARRVLENRCNNGMATETQVGKGMLNYAYDKFIGNVKEFVEYELKPKCGVQAAYHDILMQMDALYNDRVHLLAVLALSTISCTLNCIFKKKNEMNDIIAQISNAIEIDASYNAYVNSHPDNLREFETGLKKRVNEHFKVYFMKHKCMPEAGFVWKSWDASARQKLAARLMECLVKDTNLFELSQQNHGKGKQSMDRVLPTQFFIDVWNINESVFMQHAFHAIPTIIPPAEWKDYNYGGYYSELKKDFKLLRLHKNKTIFFTQYLEKLKQTDLTGVLRAVNAVQSTPWKINTKVLAVVEEIMNNGAILQGSRSFNPTTSSLD